MSAPDIVIFTDVPGWHGARLTEAFSARGFDTVNASLTQCCLNIDETSYQIDIPGCDGALPLGVFVRAITAGSLEQITTRLGVLHLLKSLGVLVYNDGRAIERTVDKGMTSMLLAAAGIPTPTTFVCESSQALERAGRLLARGDRLVLKPLFGAQGVGLVRIDTPADLALLEPAGGVYYLQELIEPQDALWSDFRVFVVDGEPCAAMKRINDFWITNRARGGRCEAIPAHGRMAELAVAATKALDIDYGGVDLIFAAKYSDFVVTEVNSIPAWQGVQQATGIDIASHLTANFVSRLGERPGHAEQARRAATQ